MLIKAEFRKLGEASPLNFKGTLAYGTPACGTLACRTLAFGEIGLLISFYPLSVGGRGGPHFINQHPGLFIHGPMAPRAPILGPWGHGPYIP